MRLRKGRSIPQRRGQGCDADESEDHDACEVLVADCYRVQRPQSLILNDDRNVDFTLYLYGDVTIGLCHGTSLTRSNRTLAAARGWQAMGCQCGIHSIELHLHAVAFPHSRSAHSLVVTQPFALIVNPFTHWQSREAFPKLSQLTSINESTCKPD